MSISHQNSQLHKVSFNGIHPELDDIDTSRFNEYELSVMAKLSKFEQRTDRLKDAVDNLQNELVTRSENDAAEHSTMRAQLSEFKISQDSMAKGMVELLDYKNKVKWTWLVITVIASIVVGFVKFFGWIIGHLK